ncbi:MAG: branched-chain amino acid aminotransferase [Alphaproteobacteria bacterium]|nr:branched-chain amino acid aminotransferase [Alphaproteobacteria bacterium]
MAKIPFDDRDGFIWMDGEMLPWREAKVHFLTHGLHYGTQVFEGERAYDGHIFRSVDHSKRLLRSAEVIHMPVPYSIEQLEQIKRELLEANGLENAYIRMAAWRGPEQMGIDVTGSKTHVAAAAWEWGSYFDPEVRKVGISLMTSQYRKPAPQTAPIESKCAGLYVLGTMAKYEAQQKGFTDAFMHDFEGYVAESSGANIFLIKDGALHTPIADRFLNGLTRQTVIQIAKDMGIEVQERRIKPEEVGGFDEIFLTGTAAEITPVGKIDDLTFTPGPLTKQLHEAYEACVRKH